jgi:hypothetical protein
MAKYDALNHFFRRQAGNLLRMTFDEVEQEAGFALPASARLHAAWWANDHDRHVQARAWLDAGYETEQVDMKARTLVFSRARSRTLPRQGGMAEAAPEYTHDGAKMPRRSPLFGALKGTFWVDPEWDLTKSTLSDDELAQWDASLDRKADLMFGKKP